MEPTRVFALLSASSVKCSGRRTSRSIISSPERAAEITVFPISGFPWFAGFGLMARLTLPIRKSATYQPSCCAPDKERSNSDNKPHSLSAALVNDLSGTWSPVRLNPMFRSFICAAFLHGTAPGSGNVREPAPSPEVGAPTYRQGERVGETDSGSRDSIQAFRIDDLRQGHFIESGAFTATIGGSNIGRPASQHVGTVRRVRSVDPDLVPMAGVSRDSHGAMVGQSRQASNTLASARCDAWKRRPGRSPWRRPAAPWPIHPR